MPDGRAVERFKGKLDAWLNWLHRHYDVRCVTMDELRRELGPTSPVVQGKGDWTCTPSIP